MEYLTEEDETKYKEHFATYIENDITFDDVEDMYKVRTLFRWPPCARRVFRPRLADYTRETALRPVGVYHLTLLCRDEKKRTHQVAICPNNLVGGNMSFASCNPTREGVCGTRRDESC